MAEEPEEVDEDETSEVLVYVVRKCGPFALDDPSGEEIADDNKTAIMALAKQEATTQMNAGHDTQIVELDEQDRIIRVHPYYTDSPGLNFAEDPDPTQEEGEDEPGELELEDAPEEEEAPPAKIKGKGKGK